MDFSLRPKREGETSLAYLDFAVANMRGAIRWNGKEVSAAIMTASLESAMSELNEDDQTHLTDLFIQHFGDGEVKLTKEVIKALESVQLRRENGGEDYLPPGDLRRLRGLSTER